MWFLAKKNQQCSSFFFFPVTTCSAWLIGLCCRFLLSWTTEVGAIYFCSWCNWSAWRLCSALMLLSCLQFAVMSSSVMCLVGAVSPSQMVAHWVCCHWHHPALLIDSWDNGRHTDQMVKQLLYVHMVLLFHGLCCPGFIGSQTKVAPYNNIHQTDDNPEVIFGIKLSLSLFFLVYSL